MTRKEIGMTLLALSAAAPIWASHNVAGAWLTETLHPVLANLLRTNLAALLYIPILWYMRGRVNLSRRHVARLAGAALCLATFFQLFYWALWLTGAGHVAIMLALGPAVTAALGVPYLGEKLGGRALVGLVIALASATLLGFVQAEGALGRNAWIGGALSFVATVAFAHYTLLSKPLLRSYPVPYVLGWTICLGTLFLWLYVPFAGIRLASVATVTLAQWLVLVYIALFMNVISYIVYNIALSKLPAGVTHAVTVYVTTIVALVMVRLILHDPVPLSYWACAFAIAVGVWLTATGRASVRQPATSSPAEATRRM